ncbi:hypothetical protein CIB95_05820 [Lottiidibacillus patelloidae]|uniref:Type 4 fimbrial biogenesis protein PilX N-terminal domain-containing protein n=1 Tax=Lottiidibacillus patelloidae TaxID=2670334 RepID=A0A263BVV3_9BACI|nr:hypothetical protein [Lottiidibacillus patelloidae]OZM57873.1 hypothetical protein CIB95_05820 [Lottiidibacillus patelloidae]
MRSINNERGATLLISLLLILLIVILTTSLAGLAVTSLKQAQMTEDNLEMTNLAEMGIVYYNNEIKSFILREENKTKSLDEIRDDFEQEFATSKTVVIDENHSFEVEAMVDNTRSDNKVMYIQVISTGIKNNTNFTKEIVANLSFTNKKREFVKLTPAEQEQFKVDPVAITKDPVFHDSSSFSNQSNKLKNCNQTTFSGSDYSFNNIDIDCDTLITVKGNADLNGVKLKEDSDLLIEESAIFYKDFEMEKDTNLTILKNAFVTHNNADEIKIKGNVTIKGNVKMDKGSSNDDLKITMKGENEDKKAVITFGDVDNPTNGNGNFYGAASEIKLEEHVDWTIYGNAYFDLSDKFEMKEGSTLTIKGNVLFENVSDDFHLKDSTIIIEGNAVFKNITDKFKLENSNIIIKKNAKFLNIDDKLEIDIDSSIQVIENIDLSETYFSAEDLEKVKGIIKVGGYALLHENQEYPLENPNFDEGKMDKLQFLLKEITEEEKNEYAVYLNMTQEEKSENEERYAARISSHIALAQIFDREEQEPTEFEWDSWEEQTTIEY